MELFIRIRDGQPFEHPILGDNFREAFPEVDVDNLPSEFARFERVPQPILEMFKKAEGPTYQWVDSIVKDVWVIRDATAQEREEVLASLTNQANITVTFLKEAADTNIASATTDVSRDAWIAHKVALDAWVLVDPMTPNFPAQPRFAPDGSVLTVNAPGSTPDVIG
jgi:hypothetical protein